MNFIKDKGGKSQVAKDEALCTLLNGQIPNASEEFSQIFSFLDDRIRQIDNKITREALSNVHGDWYEWLLAISAWNHFCHSKTSDLAILLPNISQFNVISLYESHLHNLIEDLKIKVFEVSEVNLITSNPDFVILNGDLGRKILKETHPIIELTPQNLKYLENIYNNFVGLCNFTQIVGYVSVKNSLRPDRRLQIAHEGSLMKALYAHLQTREWITDPPGLKYYAIASVVKSPDREALKTVATHSLTTVFSAPQAAVDDVFEVNTLQQADQAFSEILY